MGNQTVKTIIIDLQEYVSLFWNNKIDVVYDIGATDGSFSDRFQDSIDNQPYYYLFEANDEYKNMQKHKFEYQFFNAVLSNTEKTVDFYKLMGGGDSYYEEITNTYKNVVPIKKQTVTLNSIGKEYNLPKPDLIKLDTQGSELDILQGSTDYLPFAKLVIIECPIIEYNIGAPLLPEYINFMANYGFDPHAITQVHWYNMVMCQIDIAFVRRDILNNAEFVKLGQ